MVKAILYVSGRGRCRSRYFMIPSQDSQTPLSDLHAQGAPTLPSLARSRSHFDYFDFSLYDDLKFFEQPHGCRFAELSGY